MLPQDSNEMEIKLTHAHEKLNDALVFAKTRITNLYAYTKVPKKRYGIKSKDWWCKTLQEYMDLMKSSYSDFKKSGYNPELKAPYTEAKKLFRCRKIYNIILKRDKNLRQLDKLFLLDHQSSWKKIKSTQMKNQVIDLPVEKAADEYEEIFTVPFESTVDQEKIFEELHSKIKAGSENTATIIK